MLIRAATTDDDLTHLARIITTVSPDNPTSLEEIRWADATYPGGRRFLAWLDGEPVGAGDVGRMYMNPPEFEGLWATLAVLPEARRRGIGTALLVAISEVARAAGKTLLVGRTTSDKPEAIEFLEHRGFREHDRSRVVRLDLGGLAPPRVDPPAGVRITSLEERPELRTAVYEVARETVPDIPGDEERVPSSVEEFLARDVDRSTIPAGAFVLAIDESTGRVAGYANLLLVPGNPGVAWHAMTAVLRVWRGRGVAGALKRATIRWAIDNGLEALETQNDVDNGPMRAVNARLGYRPLPDEIGFRGPLYFGAAVGAGS